MKTNRILSLLSLTAFLLTTACTNIGELAEGYLYPVSTANETVVPNLPPTGYEQQLLTVAHADGELKTHLWFVRNETATNAPVIIHFHGNGENIGALAKGGFLAKTKMLGFHFVVMDYPGYGKSTGHPEQSTIMATAQATLEWTKKTFPNSKIIVWGWSLGSAVAFQTAGRNPNLVNALVADSAWTTVRALAKENFGSLAEQIPEELYLKNEWNSLEMGAKLQVPTLMRHGSDDKLIALHFGQELSAIIDKRLIQFIVAPGKGHGDVFLKDDFWNEMTRFINAN